MGKMRKRLNEASQLDLQQKKDVHVVPGKTITELGMLWKLRIGCPWQDLPEELGSWGFCIHKVQAVV
jgi:hypothetical protein